MEILGIFKKDSPSIMSKSDVKRQKVMWSAVIDALVPKVRATTIEIKVQKKLLQF